MSKVLRMPMEGVFPLHSSFIKACLRNFQVPKRKRPKLGEKKIVGFLDNHGNMRYIAGFYCKSQKDRRKKGFSQEIYEGSCVVTDDGLRTFVYFERVSLIADYVAGLDNEEYCANAMTKVDAVEEAAAVETKTPFKPIEVDGARIIFLTNEKRGTWEERWLQKRRKGIGGSDIGAIMGWNKYKGPATVWAEKTGKAKKKEKNFKMIAGIELEEHILKWMLNKPVKFVNSSGDYFDFKPHILRPEAMYQSTEDGCEHMLYNPDGFVVSDIHPDLSMGLIEVKTASPYVKDEFADNNVPISYMAQMQWGMGILGMKWGLLIYSIDNRDPEYTYVEFDPEVFANMKQYAKMFWEDFVETLTMPEANGADKDLIDGVIAGTEAISDEVEEKDDGLLNDLLGDLSVAKKRKKDSEKEIKTIETRVKQLLGSEGVYGCGAYKVKLSNVPGSRRVNSEDLKTKYPNIYKECSKEGKSFVKMTVTTPKGRMMK